MRYLLLVLFVLSFAIPLQAQDNAAKPGSLFLMRKPIDMNYGPYPLLAVIFNHSTHQGIKCRLCHHKPLADGQRYVPCTTSGCHSSPDVRARDPRSMFMAYHAAHKNRSCYGCHTREASSYPAFKGCRPCHTGPQKAAMQQ